MMLRGVRYHIEVSGSGPPLLLLHGFTGTHATWRGLRKRLADSFTVYAPDLLGHGRTEIPSINRMRMSEQVKDLEELLATRPERWQVVGYSMGGRIALTLSSSKHVLHTIAVSSTPGIMSAEERKARRLSDRQLAQQLRDEGLSTFIDHWEGIPLFASHETLPRETRQALRTERMSHQAEGLARSLLALGTGSMPPLKNLPYDRISWVVGEHDGKFRAIATGLSSDVHIISGAGHAPHVDQPEKFDTMIEQLLLTHMGESR